MLENLPLDILPKLFQYSNTQEVGKLAMTCQTFKRAAYHYLYPKEWEDHFDKPVMFYVPVFVFDETRANQLKQWSHLHNERQALARLFYLSKENLPLVTQSRSYYTVNLSPSQLIQSIGFFPDKPQKNYKSGMGIDPSIISNVICKKAHSAGNGMERKELLNPFYGPVLSAQTIQKTDSTPTVVKVVQPTTPETKSRCYCHLI